MSATKTCKNCEHGGDEAYKVCVRTGRYMVSEMLLGGRCAGPTTGIPEMNLWEPRQEKPRRTIWMRIADIFSKEKA